MACSFGSMCSRPPAVQIPAAGACVQLSTYCLHARPTSLRRLRSATELAKHTKAIAIAALVIVGRQLPFRPLLSYTILVLGHHPCGSMTWLALGPIHAKPPMASFDVDVLISWYRVARILPAITPNIGVGFLSSTGKVRCYNHNARGMTRPKTEGASSA